MLLCQHVQHSNESPSQVEGTMVTGVIRSPAFTVFTYFTAYKVPEISAFVSLVGSIGLSFLNFLFPIMSYHALESDISKGTKAMHVVYAIIVIISMGLGLYNSIQKLFY